MNLVGSESNGTVSADGHAPQMRMLPDVSACIYLVSIPNKEEGSVGVNQDQSRRGPSLISLCLIWECERHAVFRMAAFKGGIRYH